MDVEAYGRVGDWGCDCSGAMVSNSTLDMLDLIFFSRELSSLCGYKNESILNATNNEHGPTLALIRRVFRVVDQIRE